MASIARDDPSIGGGHVCWDRMMASTSLADAAAVFPACTATQRNPRLSWPFGLVTYRGGILAQRRTPIAVLTGLNVE